MYGRKVMGLLTVSVMLAVMLLTDQVRGDACNDRKWDCLHIVTVAAGKMVDLVGDDVTNITTVVEQCRTMQEQIASCEQELPKVCPADFDFNGTSKSMQGGYNSICGPDPMCNNQLNECQLKPVYSDKITEALLKSPPNRALVEDMCSQLNASVKQCVATLRADCRQTRHMPSVVEAILSSLQHLCGKEAQCHMQMGKCNPLLARISSARGNLHEMCRLSRAARDCVNSSLDAECLTLPQIRSLVVAFTSRATNPMCPDKAMGCPQIFDCLNRQRGGNIHDSSNQCTISGNMLECVVELKDICKLKEEPMTFSELSKLSQDFCKEIKMAGGLGSCSEMGRCFVNSGTFRHIFGSLGGSSSSSSSSSSSTPRIPDISHLTDAAIWTRYLEAVSGCIVSSAGACQFESSLVSYMSDQNAYLKAKSSSSSLGLTLRDSTLVLLVAVFTAWAHSSL